jgi:uncharacterized protein YdhG (YjbR/CyaY superfamily)
MTSKATTPDQYIAELPDDRREAVTRLRQIIKNNLPEDFVETMNYGMLGYVVPHSIYAKGYHCDPKMPLPFMNVASQKNFIAFYYMGWDVQEGLLEWFKEAYAQQFTVKLDIGKACSRYKKTEHIPYDLIGELVRKVSVAEWINFYEKNVRR